MNRLENSSTHDSRIKKNIYLQFCLEHKFQIIFVLLLFSQIFLRFYLIIQRASFGWDQVDSAWGANNILVNHKFIIYGPVAKGNSGIYIGSLYYYAIAIFYFFTNMDPIASPIFQGVLSVASFLVLYFVTKKIFNIQVALIATFISIFSITVMNADRGQSAYYLIVPISYLIFYALYKILTGKEKYVFLLAIFTGLSFHIDFTSVFYPILIFITLPFFPRTKSMLKYSFLSIPFFMVFFLPIVLVDMMTKHSTTHSLWYLFNNFYQGFHLRRVLQIAHDGFISFEQILQFSQLKILVYSVLPIFAITYYYSYPKKQSLLLFYLMSIWVIVPWIALSAYRGELTDYYFSLSRDLVIAMLAYLTVFLLQRRNILLKLFPLLFWVIYAGHSLQIFLNTPYGNLLGIEEYVRQSIHKKKTIQFKDHNPESYTYYEYMRQIRKPTL